MINQETKKLCETSMFLNYKSKEATSPYLLSDVVGVESTSAAWLSVPLRWHYVGPIGKDVTFTIKGKSCLTNLLVFWTFGSDVT